MANKKYKDWTSDGLKPDHLYTYRGASEITGVQTGTLYTWVRRGWVEDAGLKIAKYLGTVLMSGRNLAEVIDTRLSLSEPALIRAAANKARTKHRRKYPDREVARSYIASRRYRGAITPKPCEICGEANTEAHHDDYSKPAEVRWLCRKHHLEHHNGCKHVERTNATV